MNAAPRPSQARARARARALRSSLVLSLALALVARCSDGGGDPRCADPCATLGAMRCGGSAIERCVALTAECQEWSLVEDCAASGRLCLDPGTGPECGVLCTDQCSLAQTRCVDTVIQGCAPNADDCLRWVDSMDCADSTQICSLVGGDASCI